METAADAPVGNFLFEDQSIWIFLLVSVVMGGAAAWTSGKSLAQTWRPAWQIVPAMLVLGLGIRFIHFALFEGTLLSLHYYAIDVAILPIGAYQPRWFMKSVHCDPQGAVQLHRELHARRSVATHWGAFSLADEKLGEPPALLREVLRREQIPESEFRLLSLGETIVV